jgi:alpha-mannosidase
MVQVRYTIHGDNGPPDPYICDFVKKWNAKYAYPKLIMNTTSKMFHEFEERYGDKVPEVRGDFTPYWEDGAASSARETAINRNAAERLVQAEALWAILDPARFPDKRFYNAWKDVLLYDEHTWGAHCSISQPDSEFTKTQWAWKQKRALEAEKASKTLVADALKTLYSKNRPVRVVDVYNTCSWPRTDLVVLPVDWQVPIGVVREADHPPQPDSQGVITDVIASQRLSTGEVAFIAKDIPPFGSKRFVFSEAMYAGSGHCRIDTNDGEMHAGGLTVRWNPMHGGIVRLEHRPLDVQLANFRTDKGLNQYFYVPSLDQKDAKSNEPVASRGKESGPVVASVLIESDAPGCRKLQREIRLINGINRVDIINTLDKKQIREKEGVHFGFAFNVPDGVMRMDVPWAVVRPELDQMPGANKNFFTVQRWVDISNDEYGVTWATVDAPLVELGSMCAEDPHLDSTKPWLETIEPTQKLFSYVMNNYWATNYKADQEGPTTFRYSIRPHGKYDPVAAQRFGIERSQPLIVVPVDPDAPKVASRLQVEPDEVMVTSLKPSRDGKALMVRLFNPTERDRAVRLNWSDPVPMLMTVSSPAEKPGGPISEPVIVAPWEIVTLRAELPGR